jgi:hypothetical protein
MWALPVVEYSAEAAVDLVIALLLWRMSSTSLFLSADRKCRYSELRS